MPRKLLLFAAIAVVGSMLVLWLVTRDNGAASATANTTADSTPATTTTSGDRGRDRTAPSLGDTPPPRDPAAPRTRDPDDRNPRNLDPSRPNAGTVEGVERGTYADRVTEAPLEYTLPDGRRVRDFRDPATRKPLEVPPSIHAPGGRKIQPELTGLFTDQILAHMRACGKSVPSAALGTKPRLEGQIVIAIKQEQGMVTGAVFKLTQVTGDAVVESTKQCIEQAALTVKVPATGEQDLDAYSINMSFAFP